MKRILTILLAVTFVVSAFCVPVFATYKDQTSTTYIQYGTTAHDLTAYGLHTFLANKVSTVPSLTDEGIDPAQYGGVPSDTAKIGDGLTLTDEACVNDYTELYGSDYSGVELTTYLAYNDEYVFIAEKVVSPVAFSVVDEDGNVGTLNTGVRYGLNQSTAIPEAASRLYNSYAYEQTTDGFLVASCSAGNRNYKVIDGQVTESAVLDFNHYKDWDLYEYKKNTAVHYSENGGTYTYEFEYRIPLDDVIFSAVGSFDSAAVDELLAKNSFYGSYLFQVGVTRTGTDTADKNLYLSTGYAQNRVISPYGTDAESTKTWRDAVAEYWTNEDGESLFVECIPSPVFHSNASGSTVPATTGFRPGPSGYRIDKILGSYQTGKDVTFTVIPDGVDNVSPMVGDIRNVPTKFVIKHHSSPDYKGTFDSDFATGHFNTAKLGMGHNILIVTFSEQRFDGTNWVNTGNSENLSSGFTVYGSVFGSTNGSAQTGDFTIALIAIGTVMLVAAAGVTFVVLKKKKI